MNIQTSDIANIRTLAATLAASRDSAFVAASTVVTAASALGQALEPHQSELATIVAQLADAGGDHPLTIERARDCIRVAKRIKETGGKLDSSDFRQLLMWTELVPAPEPRNPEPGKPIKILAWVSRVAARIPRLNPEEKRQLRDSLTALLRQLDR